MTSYFQRSNLHWLVLALLTIPLFFLNIQEVHSWGDDFAMYIKEAMNIANGRPYNESDWIFNPYNPTYSPPQYPPGYPLLLAPVIKTFGISIRAMNYFNSFIAACLLFTLYAYFRNYAGKVASVCMAVLISYSGYMLSLKSAIIADAACLLFMTGYLAVREANTSFRWYRKALLVILAVLAIQTRSQAILLLLAEGVWTLFCLAKNYFASRKLSFSIILSYPACSVIPGTILLNLFFDKILFSTSGGTKSFYNNIFLNSMKEGLFADPGKFFDYAFMSLTAAWRYAATNALVENLIAGIVLFIFTSGIIGLLLKVYRKPAISDILFLGICVLLWHFPGKDPRYFLPAFPMFTLYAYYTIRTAACYIPNINTTVVAVLLTTGYLGLGAEHLYKLGYERPQGCVPEQRELNMFAFVSQQVKNDEIIVFTKPRMLALFTGKKTMNAAWQISHDENRKVYSKMGVKYMLVLNGLDDGYFKEYLWNVHHPADSVVIGDGYTLYTLK